MARVTVHPRVHLKRPEITSEDVIHAFDGALRTRARATEPIRWVGVGPALSGALLEFVAVENEPDGWLIYHAMPATASTLREVGLRR